MKKDFTLSERRLIKDYDSLFNEQVIRKPKTKGEYYKLEKIYGNKYNGKRRKRK